MSEVIARSVGISYPAINASELMRLKGPIPSQEEQLAIATFLDRETAKIDALVEEQRRLIELLKEKRQAVISQAVTKGLDPNVPMKDSGVEWLGEVPAHWDLAAVNYRYEVLLGKMLDEKRISGDHLAPYLRNVDVQWDRINTDDLPQMDFSGDDLARFSLTRGDLLVCEGGEVGRAAIWQAELSECYYQKALHRLRRRDVNTDHTRFMFYIFRVATAIGLFESSGGKSTIAHLTAEALRRHRFAFPPVAEQEAISSYLDKQTERLEALIIEAESAMLLLRERRSALISAAVTGKLDVRGPAAQ
jgi:type I restriction enzyme S subunit